MTTIGTKASGSKRYDPYAEAKPKDGPHKSFVKAMKELEESSHFLGDPEVHLGIDDAQTLPDATQKMEEPKGTMVTQQQSNQSEQAQMSDLMQMMITQQRAILAATSTAQVAADHSVVNGNIVIFQR